MEFLLVLIMAWFNSQEYGTPWEMEVDYIQQCEPLLDAGDFDAHDDCTSQLIDFYYPDTELEA